jgi:hypothetical protein
MFNHGVPHFISTRLTLFILMEHRDVLPSSPWTFGTLSMYEKPEGGVLFPMSFHEIDVRTALLLVSKFAKSRGRKHKAEEVIRLSTKGLLFRASALVVGPTRKWRAGVKLMDKFGTVRSPPRRRWLNEFLGTCSSRNGLVLPRR